MNKRVFLSTRRPAFLAAFICLLGLILALAACGGDSGGNAAATVTVKETKGASGDVYTCDPASITIKKGDTVAFTNQTDEIQDFDQGDAQKAGVDFKMDLNQSTNATFNTAGTFTIKSEKGATITVTVQ
jgi:plastocyanin